ncbi:DNA-directed RNA polymerase, omega subunit family protein, partial [Reticulomyxa filosa]
TPVSLLKMGKNQNQLVEASKSKKQATNQQEKRDSRPIKNEMSPMGATPLNGSTQLQLLAHQLDESKKENEKKEDKITRLEEEISKMRETHDKEVKDLQKELEETRKEKKQMEMTQQQLLEEMQQLQKHLQDNTRHVDESITTDNNDDYNRLLPADYLKTQV